MLEVGHPPGGTGESADFGNVHSWRAHFSAWAIASSPLVLSYDLGNSTLNDLLWPVIANAEALRVNEEWAGVAVRLLSSDYDTSAPTPAFARPCSSAVHTQQFDYDAESGRIRSAAPGDGRCLSAPSCGNVTTKLSASSVPGSSPTHTTGEKSSPSASVASSKWSTL